MFEEFVDSLSPKSLRVWQSGGCGKSDFIRLVSCSSAVLRDAEQGHLGFHHLMSALATDESNSQQDFEALAREAAVWIVNRAGFRPCRTIVGPSSDGQEPTEEVVYFRASEQPFLRSLSDPHPVLLATTLEPQRMIYEAVKAFAEAESPRRVFVWRVVSGLKEYFVDEQQFLQEPWARADYTLRDAEWNLGSITDHGENTDCLREELEENGFSLHDIDGPGPICPMYFRVGRESNLSTALASPEDLLSQLVKKPEPEALGRFRIDVVFDDERGDRDDEACLEFIRDNLLARVREDNKTYAEGFRGPEGFLKSLKHCSENGIPDAVYMFCDAHIFLAAGAGAEALKAMHVGAIAEAYHNLKLRNETSKIVLFGTGIDTPAELREEVVHIDLALPGTNELYISIREQLQDGMMEVADDQDFVVGLAEASSGMTLAETRATIERFLEIEFDPDLVKDNLLEAVRDAKRAMVNRSPVLELIGQDRLPSLDLGGMECFDRWLQIRERVFKEPQQARSVGIKSRPKGILLLGVPGSGKSLAAKVIARDWQMPLVRLDMGSILSSLMGSSEARIRDALKTIEAMAPCVLWIDEIDKGMAEGQQTYGHSTDLNIRATLLTWMQENAAPVFIVATANNFTRLPPELTRAGRFDARFFFGCPGTEGRRHILQIHLRAHSYEPADFFGKNPIEEDELLTRMHGFTGAEIEQVVLDGLYSAFADGGRKLEPEDLLERSNELQPIIKFFGNELSGIWELVEQGRVELASEDMLKKSHVAKLIDPELFRPMYCRLEVIQGFEKLASRAERLLMSTPFAGARLIVLETGDLDWAYVQANFRYGPEDAHNFKFIDRVETLATNMILDSLIGEFGIEAILFTDRALFEVFKENASLKSYSEFFELIENPEEEKA